MAANQGMGTAEPPAPPHVVVINSAHTHQAVDDAILYAPLLRRRRLHTRPGVHLDKVGSPGGANVSSVIASPRKSVVRLPPDRPTPLLRTSSFARERGPISVCGVMYCVVGPSVRSSRGPHVRCASCPPCMLPARAGSRGRAPRLVDSGLKIARHHMR